MGQSGELPSGTSRKIIDLATGVLVGLRGCSPQEAFAELVDVVKRARIGIGSVASQLVALAAGAPVTDNDYLKPWADLVERRRDQDKRLNKSDATGMRG